MPYLPTWKRVAFAMFTVGWGANQFTPMLLAYRNELAMSEQTRAFLFGVYAAGLIPALLIGGAASDRWGRRALVLPAVVVSPLATVLLMVEEDSTVGLCVARLAAGVCSGVVFSAASAWVAELSTEEAAGTAARRAAIALSAGFGLGPLATGLLAEWLPHPLVTPYLPHVVLGTLAILLVWPAPNTGRALTPRALLRLPAATRSRRFLTVVVPSAPWVFGSAAISIAFLPSGFGADSSGELAFAGVLAGITLGTGVLIQGPARRLDDRRPLLAGQVGLLAAAVGCAIGVAALAAEVRMLMLVSGPVLGAGYGLILVSGLRETERLSAAEDLGATVAVFYALTYLGFAAPYALGAVGGGSPALIACIALALVSLTMVSIGRRTRLTTSLAG